MATKSEVLEQAIPGKLRQYEVNTFWDANFPGVFRSGRRWYFCFGFGAVSIERIL